MHVVKLWAFLQSFNKNPNSGSIICEVASPCFGFEPVNICCKGFLFLLLNIHETCKVYVWILVLHNLSHSNSFISSQDLSELIASVTNVWVNPLNLAFASLSHLSLDRSAAVSKSINQYSNFDRISTH